LLGDIRKRARVRTGCPGIAASSTSCSLGGLGCWQRRGCTELILRNHGCTTSTGKCGTPCERCRTSTSRLDAPGGEKARREIHERCGSGGWPGPHLILCALCAKKCARTFRVFFAQKLFATGSQDQVVAGARARRRPVLNRAVGDGVAQPEMRHGRVEPRRSRRAARRKFSVSSAR